jgi:multiphosphoryl transfer protein
MSPERTLRGTPASPGVAGGRVRRLEAAVPPDAITPGDEAKAGGRVGSPEEERRRAEAALAEAGAELEKAAATLGARGDADEAEILEANALICADPALLAEVGIAVERGAPAASAIEAAADSLARKIESVPDPVLAARGADVRSIGRRAAMTLLRAGPAVPAGEGGEILVAPDLGPADVLDLEGVAGIALAAGAPAAHAAIVARSLGIPMVVGLGEGILDEPSGRPLVVDGTAGTATLDPTPARLAELDKRHPSGAQGPKGVVEPAPDLSPARTADGEPLPVRLNVAGVAEVRAGIAAGAEGIGLLRTEIALLRAEHWPTVEEHRRALRPLLAALPADVLCTVRTLDFGADKTPPFLAGVAGRGVELQLAAEGALAAQLQALALERGELALRVMLPVVERVDQIEAARELLPAGTHLGAMIETGAAVAASPELLGLCDFAGIGTNDLAHDLLGLDRGGDVAAAAHHPRVLAAIATVAGAAAAAGIPLEVCGEAASDPIALPLLVGLGVSELSVGAARVGPVKAWLRGAGRDALGRLAERALELGDEEEVAALVGPQPHLAVESTS